MKQLLAVEFLRFRGIFRGYLKAMMETSKFAGAVSEPGNGESRGSANN
jgi:hypothetical protein